MKGYILLGVVITQVVLGGAGPASAQDASGEKSGVMKERESEGVPLEDRIKSVERKVFIKKHRFEIAPFYAQLMNDAFKEQFLIGGDFTYHIADSLAFDLQAAMTVLSLDSDNLKSVRSESEVSPLIADLKYLTSINFMWTPIYGKISLMAEKIFHYDTYLVGGLGLCGTTNYGATVGKKDGKSGMNFSADAGIGQRYFIARWMTVRWELRDYIYVVKFDDVEMRGANVSVSDIRNNLLIFLGCSFFFPTTFSYEYR